MHWTAKESLSWVSIDSGSTGSNNASVVYSVTEYAGANARTGTITVARQSFTVIQTELGVPVNVQATDGVYEDRTDITWDELSGATGYYVYRNVNNSSGGASYIGYVSTNVFSDIGGLLDQVYYYWIRPANGGGSGGLSLPDTGFRSNGVVDPAWIALHFPGSYPGNAVDSDDDGFANIDEFIAGTIPTDAQSYFKISGAESSTDGFVVNWNSESGRVYAVDWTASLTNTFQNLTTNLTYPQNSYTDAVHTAEGEGFYSLKVELEN